MQSRASTRWLRGPSLTAAEAKTLSCCTRTARTFTTSQSRSQSNGNTDIDVAQLLSKPTWSVASLLPRNDGSNAASEVSSKQLHHLLRLSALPPPANEAAEAQMLSTLSSQLHFVKDVQSVDTSGVEPLRSLRDETVEGEKEAELGLDEMKDALEAEEIRGTHHRRIRRKREAVDEKVPEERHWDPLQTASKKMGRYFVVKTGK